MEIKEKYISEALLKDSPKKKLSLKIGEGVIKPEHLSKRIADEIIIPLIEEKLVGDLDETIREAIRDLVADVYSREEVDGKIDNISDICDDLQEQIDALNIDKATVNLTVSPSTVFVGGTYTVTLTATSSVAASSITLKHNGADMQIGEGTSFTINATVEATTSGTESYSAVFTINGVTKTVSKTLTKVNKIYYGVGTENSYDGVNTPKSIQTNANGSYTFITTSENKYAYILVPYAMSAINLNNVKLESGFGYNLTLITDNVTIDNARYRVYRSAENAANESFTVVIS